MILQLLDIEPAIDVLNGALIIEYFSLVLNYSFPPGVKMELEDCALPLLEAVICTTDPRVAFKDAHVAVMLGAMPRKQGMERKDLLRANAEIFKKQGMAMNEVANRDIKVLVVGNPANTNAFIISHYAKDIPKKNFTALTRLDHNRGKGQLALRLGVSVGRIKNMIIWGNHSSTQYPDVSHAYVIDDAGKQTPIETAVHDEAWLHNDFIKTVQQRGAAVIAARKLSSAMSAAKGVIDHVHDWWCGTPDNEFVSMAVQSDGSYGIKEGVIYSYPVTCKNGEYTIVQGLPISDFSRKLMDDTAKELFEEREEALSFLEQA